MLSTTSRTFSLVEEHWDRDIVPALVEYIRIPNKSIAFDANWESAGHMQAAIELLKQQICNFPLASESHRVVQIEGKTPLLYIEVPAFKGGTGNVVLYGHYDKQPEFDGWREGLGPWIPVQQNGRLYGRGGADDGYAMFGSLCAISVMEQQGIPHGRCVILIEGSEESGSIDLPYYLKELEDEVGAPDLLICLDAECGNYDQLWLTTSLRGVISGTLRTKVLTEGVHSGGAGGIVPSSFRILRSLLDRIEDSKTGELHASLACELPDWVQPQSLQVASILDQTVIERYPWEGSTEPDSHDLPELVTNNTWRASLAYVGLGGAPLPQDAGNTLRPQTEIKLVFRTPPILDANKVAAELKSELERDPPNNASVQFEIESAESGWASKPVAPWLEAALEEASQSFFEAPMCRMGTGGTIPFMRMLADQYPQCEFVVTGVLGPHSNAHGPNEFLDIDTGKRVTASMVTVLEAAAQVAAS